MLKIEVFKENEHVEIRTIPAKDDKPSRDIYEQIAYVYLGGKFPVEMKLSLEKGQVPYAPGFYTLHPSSFAVNQYGALELKRFGQVIAPMEAEL